MIVFSLLVIFAVGVFCYRSQQWALDRKKMINVVRCLRHMELEGCRDNTSVCQAIHHSQLILLRDLVPFQKFPNWSGDRYFPIKHPDIESPRTAFFQEPRWEGGYGKERKRFCRWCADYLCKKWRIKDGDY